MTVEILLRRRNTSKVLEGAGADAAGKNGEGWRIEGAPFEDKARGEWCWDGRAQEVKPAARRAGSNSPSPIKRGIMELAQRRTSIHLAAKPGPQLAHMLRRRRDCSTG